MLNSIYMLSPQDVQDFEALNAMPEQSQGALVPIMFYRNANEYSSIILNMTGTPSETIPEGFIVTNESGSDNWSSAGILVENNGELIIDSNMLFDNGGNATGIYAICETQGAISAASDTITRIVNPNPNITSVTNQNESVLSGVVYGPCVDITTIDDDRYILWRNILETNQPISERDVITVTLSEY